MQSTHAKKQLIFHHPWFFSFRLKWILFNKINVLKIILLAIPFGMPFAMIIPQML